MMLPRVDLLGVMVDCLDRNALLERVMTWALQPDRHLVTYVNAHCLNQAVINPTYRAILNRADLVYSDGVGAVWAGRILGKRCLEKITGRDWIEGFCQRASDHRVSLYILAGKPHIARQAADRLTARWPALRVVAARDGFFYEKSEAEVLAEIATLRPDVLFVGMGVPQQELWVAHHWPQLAVRVCWAVGALFDFVAGVEPPVPAWANRLNLEWLWRLAHDPCHKWRRYLFGNPQFVVRVMLAKLKTSLQR